MARWLAVTIALAALLGVFLLPEVDRARLACLSAHEFFAPEEPGHETLFLPSGEAFSGLTEQVLSGPAARPKPEGGTELALYGVRIGAEAEARADIAANLVLRRSIVRGLRQNADARHAPLSIVGEEAPVAEAGGASFYLQLVGDEPVLVYDVRGSDASRTVVRRGWTPARRTALLPAVMAVVLAVLFRRPVLALSCGVLSGAFLVHRARGDGLLASAGGGALDVLRRYLWDEVCKIDRLEIVGFVVCMLAMVGVMTRAGGIRGLMDRLALLARDARRTQLAAYAMGLAVFFDDYANTILVGSTMRPLTDRFRVSREKLSFIVDSTAAPVAGISIFSTWIAFEVSTFSAQLPAAGLAPGDGYSVFLQTVPYSYYCLFALVFVGLMALSGRDFGPMLRAERRARATGALVAPGATPMVSSETTSLDAAPGVTPRAWRALVPLAVFIGGTLLWILHRGGALERLRAGELFTLAGATGVLYDGSGSEPLLVGAALGLFAAGLAAVAAGIGRELPRAAWTTLRSMWVAFAILYLAWMIGRVCEDVGTASYMTALVGEALDPRLLPALLFVLAGLVAFATGSSWSTMSILLPLVVGLAYHLGLDAGLAGTAVESGRRLMVLAIAATLSGAIFGDHCSPISDTTVMSSIASASDHIDHVRTQAPYALLVMAVALVAGYLPATYYGWHPAASLALGTGLLVATLAVLGRTSEPARGG